VRCVGTRASILVFCTFVIRSAHMYLWLVFTIVNPVALFPNAEADSSSSYRLWAHAGAALLKASRLLRPSSKARQIRFSLHVIDNRPNAPIHSVDHHKSICSSSRVVDHCPNAHFQHVDHCPNLSTHRCMSLTIVRMPSYDLGRGPSSDQLYL
jgi:hypothetical protein